MCFFVSGFFPLKFTHVVAGISYMIGFLLFSGIPLREYTTVSFKDYLFICLFVWLRRVLVAAGGLLSCDSQAPP